MSTKSKDLQIILDENKTFIPGDQIKGNVVVQSSKPIDVQYISLCFKCYAAIQGDGKVLHENVLYLAKPKTGKSSSSILLSNDTHRFPFSFIISENLPSTLKIPKMASITYSLTAIHKKPLFKLSSTLPTQTQDIEVTQNIDICSEEFKNEKRSQSQFGHVISSSETEWSTIIPRTGFFIGDSIPVEIDIRHFPPFKKSDAIKVSLLRLVNKTEPFKTIEKKSLATKIIDLDTKKLPSQRLTVTLNVPLDTPASLFPPNGQIMSIQYVVESELYLKDVKKAFIKAKKVYTHENVIVLGTRPKPVVLPPQVNKKLTDSMYIPPTSPTVREVEEKISMMSVTSLPRGSVVMHNNGYEALKPLKRLDGVAPMKYTYNKRQSTKEEVTNQEAELPIMLEQARRHAQSEPCLPSLIQEEKDIPSLPMLMNDYKSTPNFNPNTNGVIKPFDPNSAPVHQNSFQSYESSGSQSPQTPDSMQYFSSPRPAIHPLYPPHRSSLQYREQITGSSIPHEYSPEELEAKHILRSNTPDLSRNNTLSTVSTHSTAEHQQRFFATNKLT